ncbi:MAG: LysR family transcriptional regulator [Haliscomenobacter sp.]
MNIQQLRNALILAKRLHFTKTAEEASIVQPALSRQISTLEAELGVQLFKRHKRKVELTPAGEYFTAEMEKLLVQFDLIQQKACQIAKGQVEIRIGFTHSIKQSILPEVLNKIRKSRPGICFVLKEVNNEGQFKGLQTKQLDLGFSTNPIIPPNLFGKKLTSCDFVILLPKNHPVTEENYQAFSVFAKEEFIFPPLEDGSNHLEIMKSICLDAGFTPNITHTTSSAGTAFKLVENGMGVCLEPENSIQGLNLPLNIIPLRKVDQKAELTIIWNEDFAHDFPELLAELSDPAHYAFFNTQKKNT